MLLPGSWGPSGEPPRPSSRLFNLVPLTHRGADQHWRPCQGLGAGWQMWEQRSRQQVGCGAGEASASLDQSHHQAAQQMDQSLQGGRQQLGHESGWQHKAGSLPGSVLRCGQCAAARSRPEKGSTVDSTQGRLPQRGRGCLVCYEGCQGCSGSGVPPGPDVFLLPSEGLGRGEKAGWPRWCAGGCWLLWGSWGRFLRAGLSTGRLAENPFFGGVAHQ